jgi:hypothetical protein
MEELAITQFSSENLKGMNHSGELGIDRRIILKRT